ncbi:MAG: hypothetical protein JNK72_00640 [Myxococcales bacterium]|nr:hypothetical protein [Myxococcales bacterium]
MPLSLALGCSAPPTAGLGRDANAGDLGDPTAGCQRLCGAGEVCVGLRCIARSQFDAGQAALDGPSTDRFGVTGDTGTTGTPPGRCCGYDRPSCGCVRLGGSPDSQGVCRRACGVGAAGSWVLRTDLAGCAYWSVPDLQCVDDDAGAVAADVVGDNRDGALDSPAADAHED